MTLLYVFDLKAGQKVPGAINFLKTQEGPKKMNQL